MSLELKLGDILVDLPEEFTWRQFIRMQKYNQENLTNIDLIHICTGIDPKEIKKASLEQIEVLSDLFALKYFSNEPKGEVYTTFTYDGCEYGLQKDFSKLSYGSWMDLEVYSADDVNKNIPKIMANLYYPIIDRKKGKIVLKEYDDSEVEDRSVIFEDLPIKYWYGASTFFLLFVSQYMDAMVSSLRTKNKIEKLMMIGWKTLPKFLRKRLSPGSISKL